MFQLDNVSKRYGAVTALDAVSLAFATGSITALVGSSGSGKSTVLRLLLELERPDAGTLHTDAQALGAQDTLARRRRMGYVIQDGGLFPHLSAGQNVALLARQLGWDATRVAARIAALVELVRFPRDALVRYPLELSGGQRQRVALMRALMLDPPVLLLDEPLSALDPIARRDLQDELAGLFATLAKTVILVTHDLAEAAFLAPRLVLMDGGRVQQIGSLEALRRTPANAWVQRFVEAQRSVDALA